MSTNGDFVSAQTSAGIFYDGKCFGQNLVHLRGEFVFVLDPGKVVFLRGSFRAQLFVGKLLQSGFNLVDLPDERPKPADFAVIF